MPPEEKIRYVLFDTDSDLREDITVGGPPPHDYDAGREFMVDHKPDPRIMEALRRIAPTVLATGFPELTAITGFTVTLVENLAPGILARYITGTRTHPVIVFSAPAHLAACATYHVQIDVAVCTTLLHELFHAAQDTAGLNVMSEQAERDAECFARASYRLCTVAFPAAS